MTNSTLHKMRSLINLAGKNHESYPRPTIMGDDETISDYVDRVVESGDEETRLLLAQTLAELPSELQILNPQAWISKLIK